MILLYLLCSVVNRVVYSKQTPNVNGTNQGSPAMRKMGVEGEIGKKKGQESLSCYKGLTAQ